jgi:nucleotide-binding universal stress UspA family protein
MLAVKTILHPTDFSECSELAFRRACTLARDYGARLLVLHVAEPVVAVGGEGIVMLPPGSDLDSLQSQLQQIQSKDPEVKLEHRLAQGDAVTEILQVANDNACDLIVMGTHGRTGLRRLLMGSVAEQVVRKASCPVLTARMHLDQASASEESLVPGEPGQVAQV